MSYKDEFRRWLDSPALSAEEWRELDAMRSDEAEQRERFSAPPEFGTAGLRGKMGIGLSRLNVHIVRWTTQALSRLIAAEGDEARRRGVAIAYDCRENSELFAREAACVCAANGVRVRLFESLRPTPELSFAIRHYHTMAGINITASHNTKEYNGYKVYWSDGAQLPPQHAKAVADMMQSIDLFEDIATMPLEEAVEKGDITWLGAETDELFIARVLGESVTPGALEAAGDFSVVYTPFHGAGYRIVPEMLRRLGVQTLYPVAEQMEPDGTFPTVASPNPENPEGFALAVALAKEYNASLILGTDPDSDRLGVLTPDGCGGYVHLTGNQVGALLLDYIVSSRKRSGTLPDNAAAVSTIVSTGMVRAICETNGIHFDETFTGFKFMAEKIAAYESAADWRYIFAFEESYGYMTGDYVRDKDAVTAAMLVTEMAAVYHAQGMTLRRALDGLYVRYGRREERSISVYMEGLDGKERMNALMQSLRETPPMALAGRRVLRVRDYSDGTVSVPGLGMVDRTPIVGSNVLYFELEDRTAFIVRPSGTEPKIKFYFLIQQEDASLCAATADACESEARRLCDGEGSAN